MLETACDLELCHVSSSGGSKAQAAPRWPATLRTCPDSAIGHLYKTSNPSISDAISAQFHTRAAVSSRISSMYHRQSQLPVDPELKDRMFDQPPRSGHIIDGTAIEAFKADTPLERDFIAESEQVQLFRDADNVARAQKQDSQPQENQGDEEPEERITLRANKDTAQEDDLVVREIEKIGGKPEERKEIGGKPITPTDARLIQSEENMLGNPTGVGSFAARMQSAAAANVREGVVSADSGVSATKWDPETHTKTV